MIKITSDNIGKAYFKEKGSFIYNYPSYRLNPSNTEDVFQHGNRTIEYRVNNYHKSRDVLNLISTHATDKLGVSILNIHRLDITNGFWWYDPFKDISEEVEQLFDKFLNELI